MAVITNSHTEVFNKTWQGGGLAEVTGAEYLVDTSATSMTLMLTAVDEAMTFDVDLREADGVFVEVATQAVAADTTVPLNFDYSFPFRLRVTPGADPATARALLLYAGHAGGPA